MLTNIIVALVAALVAVVWIHPRIVNIALLKNIVDNPNARKLQTTPVPVLGGVAIFFGMVLGIALTCRSADSGSLLPIMAAMLIMLYIGTMDDIVNLTARLRFVLEIGVVVLLIYISGMSIDDFHGLWGVGVIPMWVAVPLTIFATVGIINSVNLIDGANGLSSGFCILASIVFGIFFYITGSESMLVLCAVSVGALIPFLFHNVFGSTSRMFLGDGGALVMGVVMATFVVNVLASNGASLEAIDPNFGVVPFVLAVMAVPVFDTIRVMISRMVKGVSPSHPDKTHLHHLFIGHGFSHAGTTVCILTLNALIIVAQYLTWYWGGSIELQLYVVIGLGVATTWGLFHGVSFLRDDNPIKRMIRGLGRATHFERKGIFLILQKMSDRM